MSPLAHRPHVTGGLLAVLLAAVTGCSPQAAPTRVAAPDPLTVASPSATSPAPPSLAPATAAPTLSPSLSPTPRPTPTYDVRAVQARLVELGYYLGPVDGRPGPAQRSAVMAFQKVQGLGADGVVGPATLAALRAPRQPVLKGSGGDRVEVDLTRQVLYLVKGSRVTRILPVSSGNGATYQQKDGRTARALTPVGYFRIERRIVGERKADLGSLYDPQYFYRGWAIHGSYSVPARPASHGCVRVTLADARWLLGQIDVGTLVYLHGGTHTFTAGSSAPGTDTPSGDTPPPAEPTASPTASPTPSPTPSPTSQPGILPVTSPTPTPTGAGRRTEVS